MSEPVTFPGPDASGWMVRSSSPSRRNDGSLLWSWLQRTGWMTGWSQLTDGLVFPSRAAARAPIAGRRGIVVERVADSVAFGIAYAEETRARIAALDPADAAARYGPDWQADVLASQDELIAYLQGSGPRPNRYARGGSR